MPWPIESDYFSAVQNPQTNFADAELRAGTVTTNALGLPRPITGAFASVYQINCPSGRRWAVRCFLRDIPDQHLRYAAISAHLQTIRLPYTVGFEYIERGIRVGVHWYPILKMEWIEGVPLNVYVEKNLASPLTLHTLAKQWIEMMAALKMADVAHGDLQHGNVLVAGGTIRLIDYDGIYVPALRGMHSNEEGHRNYQHPKRSGADYHSQLDNFSAWVIFVSLSALTIDPSLWAKANAGDECLLFRREDFERPSSSRALAALDASGRPELQSLSAHLRSLLYLPLAQVPGLDGLAAPPPRASARATGNIPAWLSGHLAEDKPGVLNVDVSPPMPLVAGADWLFDHLLDQKPLPPILAVISVTLDRVLLALLSIISIAGGISLVHLTQSYGAAASLAGAAFTAAFAVLVFRYSSAHVVGLKKAAAIKVAESRRAVARIEDGIQAVNAERQMAMEPLVAIDKAYRMIPQQLSNSLRAIEQDLENTLATLVTRMEALNKKEMQELSRIDSAALRKREELVRRRNNLATAEAHDRQHMLEHVRENYVRNVMTNTFVAGADLPGIGAKLKDRLRAAGINSAADVDWRVHGVPGIGAAKAATLQGWRDAVEGQARSDAPAQLSSADTARLSAKYQADRRAIDQQVSAVADEQVRERQTVSSNYLRYRHQVAQEEDAARRECHKQMSETTIGFQNEKERLAKKFEALKARIDIQRRELDARLVELNQSNFRRRIDLNTDQRELERYRGVTFVKYVQRVFGKRSAA